MGEEKLLVTSQTYFSFFNACHYALCYPAKWVLPHASEHDNKVPHNQQVQGSCYP